MILNEEGNGFQPLQDMLLYSLGGYMMKNTRVVLHVGCFLYLLENLTVKRHATAVRSHLGNSLLCYVKPYDKFNLLVEICPK